MITNYDFRGVEDLGVDVFLDDKRVIVSIHCRLQPYIFNEEFISYEYEDGDSEDEKPGHGFISKVKDPLLRLLAEIRGQLMQGDYRALYEVWKVYGFNEEEDDDPWSGPPVPEEKDTGKSVITVFAEMLDTL